jgi:hypothetical protein
MQTFAKSARLPKSGIQTLSGAQSRDSHDPVLSVATLLPMFPFRYTKLIFQSSESVTTGHDRILKYISHHFSFSKSAGHLHARTAAGLTQLSPVRAPVL